MSKLTKTALSLVTGAIVLSGGYGEARRLTSQPEYRDSTSLQEDAKRVNKFLDRVNQPILMVVGRCGQDPAWCSCPSCRIRNAQRQTGRQSFTLADFVFGVRGDHTRQERVAPENIEYIPGAASFIVPAIFGFDGPGGCSIQLLSIILGAAAESGVTPNIFRAVIEQMDGLRDQNGSLYDKLMRKIDDMIALVSQTRLVS
ncbi:MAG: hypothetical protein LBJ03_04160 [Holosporales bacterium]|jgi:hypothetical protein|nr:hypothetical protein [Holosporales bacterium]